MIALSFPFSLALLLSARYARALSFTRFLRLSFFLLNSTPRPILPPLRSLRVLIVRRKLLAAGSSHCYAHIRCPFAHDAPEINHVERATFVLDR